MLWNDLSRRMPALLMTMSTLPYASIAVCTMRFAALGCGDAVVVGNGFAARGLDLVHDGLGRRLRRARAVGRTAEVVHHDQRAALGQFQCVRPAEAATGARDDRYLAVETEISHGRKL